MFPEGPTVGAFFLHFGEGRGFFGKESRVPRFFFFFVVFEPPICTIEGPQWGPLQQGTFLSERSNWPAPVSLFSLCPSHQPRVSRAVVQGTIFRRGRRALFQRRPEFRPLRGKDLTLFSGRFFDAPVCPFFRLLFLAGSFFPSVSFDLGNSAGFLLPPRPSPPFGN